MMENRLYALIAAAEDQQKAVEQATQALDSKLQELDTRVKSLERLGMGIARVLNEWHEEFGQKVSEATKETLKKEIVGDIKSLGARLDAPLRETRQTAYVIFASAVLVLIASGVVLWNSLN